MRDFSSRAQLTQHMNVQGGVEIENINKMIYAGILAASDYSQHGVLGVLNFPADHQFQ